MLTQSQVPSSPDELQSGIRGRVEGVTRIGPRAMLLGALMVTALLSGIIFGVTRTPKSQSQQIASTTVPPVAPPQPSPAQHFGENVPIVESPPPVTAPPAVLLPASPPPLQQDTGFASPPPNSMLATSPVAVSTLDPTMLAKQKQDNEELRRRDEAAARAQTLQRAYQAPIFASAQGGGAAPNGLNGSGPPAAAVAASAPDPPAAGNASVASGSSASSGNASSASANLAYLSGPTGQFASTGFALQRSGPGNNTLPATRYAPSTIYELTAGTVIPAALITGIDSEQPGLVTGQVREDVYDSKSGRHLLIPRGSRLIGVYKSDVAFGRSRVLVAWQRLIFPDTSSIDLLNMTGADVQGGGGLGGKVDNHTGQIIGATLLSAVLAAGVQLAQPPTQTVVGTSGGAVAIPSAGQLAAQGVGQQIVGTTQGMIQKNLDVPPVVYVPKGYPFLVIVDRDMIFPGPYGEGS